MVSGVGGTTSIFIRTLKNQILSLLSSLSISIGFHMLFTRQEWQEHIKANISDKANFYPDSDKRVTQTQIV